MRDYVSSMRVSTVSTVTAWHLVHSRQRTQRMLSTPPLRPAAIEAQIPAQLAIPATSPMKAEEHQRNVVHQSVDRPQRAEQRAPRPPDEEHGDQEQAEDRPLRGRGPDDRLARHRQPRHVGHRPFERAGGTEAAEEQRMRLRPTVTEWPTRTPPARRSESRSARRAG